MKPTIKKKLDLTKVRTRYEPPTLEEAIFAAQGLSNDLEQQVAIARELTGNSEEEVRQAAQQLRLPSLRGTVTSAQGPRRPVVVEKRSLRVYARHGGTGA